MAAAAFSYRSSPEAVVVDCMALSRLVAKSMPCGQGVLTTPAFGALGAPITIRFPRAVGTTTLKTRIDGHIPSGFFLLGGGPDDVIVPPALVPVNASLDEHDLLVDANNSQLVQARLVGRLTHDVVSYVPVYTSSETPSENGTLQKLEVLLTAIVLVVLGIAAAGLAIGAIEGVLERRRTLAHLAATGVSARTLRTATILEIAAPMGAALILGRGRNRDRRHLHPLLLHKRRAHPDRDPVVARDHPRTCRRGSDRVCGAGDPADGRAQHRSREPPHRVAAAGWSPARPPGRGHLRSETRIIKTDVKASTPAATASTISAWISAVV